MHTYNILHTNTHIVRIVNVYTEHNNKLHAYIHYTIGTFKLCRLFCSNLQFNILIYIRRGISQ